MSEPRKRQKLCIDCLSRKPSTEFNRYSKAFDGLSSFCRACASVRNAKWRRENSHRLKEVRRESYQRCSDKRREEKRRYHALRPEVSLAAKLHKFWPEFTPTEALNNYKSLLALQNHVCAICKAKESLVDHKTNKPKRLAVDHCHTTGEVRGLLCGRCNAGLGFLRDREELVVEAVRYLQR